MTARTGNRPLAARSDLPLIPLLLLWTALCVVSLVQWENVHPDYALGYFWPRIGVLTWRGFLRAQAVNSRELLTFFMTLAAFVGAGHRALAWMGARRAQGVFGTGLRLMGGSAVLGFAAAGFALAGLADRRILLVAGLLALTTFRPRLMQAPGLRESLAECPRPLKYLGSLVVLGTLLGALAPEVAMDGLEVYLELPRRAWLAHRLVPDPYLALTWAYLLPTGTALMLEAWGSEIAVRLWSFASMVLVALLMHEWQVRRGDGRHAWWAPVSWCCLSAVANFGQVVMQEMPLAVLVLLALQAQFNRRRSDLAGACWGLALGYKLVVVGYAAAALIAALIVGMTNAAAWAVWISLAASPWLARNWLQAGVPTAPVFLAGAAGEWVRNLPGQAGWAGHRTVGRVLRAPWEARSISVVSPMLIAGIPAALLLNRIRWQGLFLIQCVAYWIWLAGNNARYLIPLAPILLISFWNVLLGTGSRRQSSPLVRGGGLALMGVEAILTFSWLYYTTNPLSVTLGRESRVEYLSRVLVPRQAKMQCAARMGRWGPISAGKGYYLVGDIEGHYLGGRPLVDEVNGMPRALVLAAESIDEQRLRVKFTQSGMVAAVMVESGQGRAIGYVRSNAEQWPRRELALVRGMFLHHAQPTFRVASVFGSCAAYELGRQPLSRPLLLSGEALLRWWDPGERFQ